MLRRQSHWRYATPFIIHHLGLWPVDSRVAAYLGCEAECLTNGASVRFLLPR